VRRGTSWQDDGVTGTHSLGQHAPEAHGAPDAHSEHERPEDWGWHGETGKWGRVGAWIAVLATLTYLIGNHEGRVENLWILGVALTMVVLLLWDARRRKNAWRAR
jgi:hypothetical protein